MTGIKIYILSYADYARVTGHRPDDISGWGFLSARGAGEYMICINEADPLDEQYRTLAHELAHLALGHVDGGLCLEEQAERLSEFILNHAKALSRLRDHQEGRLSA